MKARDWVAVAFFASTALAGCSNSSRPPIDTTGNTNPTSGGSSGSSDGGSSLADAGDDSAAATDASGLADVAVCNTGNCIDGCCDTEGVCHNPPTSSACGLVGAACQVCEAGTSCQLDGGGCR